MNPPTPDHAPFSQSDSPRPRGASRPLPICWAILDDATAARELSALAVWVRWLATRYILAPRTIPPCWHHHASLVEELSALRTAWLAAFAPDVPSVTPLDWHIMFWPARNRLEETVTYAGCTKQDHHDDRPAAWLTTPTENSASSTQT